VRVRKNLAARPPRVLRSVLWFAKTKSRSVFGYRSLVIEDVLCQFKLGAEIVSEEMSKAVIAS